MTPRFILAALCVGLLLGCSKKPVKPTDSSEDKAPPSQAKPSSAGADASKLSADKKKGSEKPNWLKDPRFQKDEASRTEPESSGIPGKPGWGLSRPEGGWEKPQAGGAAPGVAKPAVSSPASPPAGAIPTPLTGAAPAAPTVAGKPVSEADMKEVWVYIDTRSGASGQMPAPKETLQALTDAGSKAADLVRDGSIVLTGSRGRESVWAYEKNALAQGGWMVSQSGVERVGAENLAGRLGR